MCGIHGFNFTDKDLIDKMIGETKHRGPDDSGFFLSSGWSLGHNRLSIIDLSSDGHQPMHTKDGRYSIVFNGEIYNFQEIKNELLSKGYQFFSKTDTEVILFAYQEWGKECLKRFNGMFAFALLDNKTEELFLARDPIGIKPLYYHYENGRFIFASEAKAILRHGISRELDTEAMNMYFRLLYVPAPFTIWKKIRKLEAGSYATVKNGELVLGRYWNYPDTPLLSDKREMETEIKRLLLDSVKLQLVSDRPIGVFLSGGIDSTIITGLMSTLTPHVQTFSVGFEETEESEKYNNDMKVARQTAKHFGTAHNEYTLSSRQIIDALPSAIYHMDEPISNHVQAVNMLLAKSVREKATVVLGGDGGDELFGGYERYYYNYLIDSFQKLPSFLRTNAATGMLLKSLQREDLFRKLNTPPGVSRYMEFFAQKEKMIASFLKPSVNAPGATESVLEDLYFKKTDSSDFTRQFMRTDVLSWLPSESLARSDKMSMAAGIEQRVPFLDHRLVEFADRIPVRYKIGAKGLRFGSVGHHYEGKLILKSAMKEYLPEFVLSQPKWGWFSPAAKWIRGEMEPLLREVLDPGFNAETAAFFDFGVLNKILDDHISKKHYALNTLWSVMTFQLWYKQFMKD